MNTEVNCCRQNIFATTASTNVATRFATKLGRDSTLEPLLAFKTIKCNIGFVARVCLKLCDVSTFNNSKHSQFAVSYLNDLWVFTGTSNKVFVRENTAFNSNLGKSLQT